MSTYHAICNLWLLNVVFQVVPVEERVEVLGEVQEEAPEEVLEVELEEELEEVLVKEDNFRQKIYNKCLTLLPIYHLFNIVANV